VLPVLLICLLLLYVAPSSGTAPLRGQWVVAGVAATAGLNAVACWAGSRVAARLAERGTPAASLRAVRVVKLLNAGVAGFVMLDVFAFGWPAFVASSVAERLRVPLVADLVLLSPLLLMVCTAIAFQYRLRCRAVPGGPGPWRYLLLRVRTEVAVLLAPWLALVLVSDLSDALAQGTRYYALTQWVVPLCALAGAVVLGPFCLRLVWGAGSLPAGPLRERLERFCRAQRFLCRDILLWRTYNSIPNAAVVGIVPFARYVLLTDALVLHCTPEEVEAVFAHEVGHVKHHHMAFYVLFALGFVGLYANFVDLLARFGWVSPLEELFRAEPTGGQAVALLVLAGLYWVVGFGYLSRRFEQQADLFALRVSSRPEAFGEALQKLAQLSGVPAVVGSWRHFSISRRRRFLAEARSDPLRARRAERTARALQLAVAALCLGAAVRIVLRAPHLLPIA